MNSLDPWRVILTDPFGEVIFPRASYGHPFYMEIPSWIHYGEGNGVTRKLFDGVFIGADVNNTLQPRTGLVAEVAPIVAPATGAITVKKELDDKQSLHVEICVDGKCYRTSMDLAPVFAMLMDKLAQWHRGMHAQMWNRPQAAAPMWNQNPSTAAVAGGLEAIVGQASDTLVDALVYQHIECVCGSFLDDIGNAVKGVASGLASGVTSTLKQLKGPIAATAGIAAASGAALIPGVGAIAAPIAGKLANDLVNSTIGDPAAQKRVAQVKQQAQTNPAIAVALDQAQKAVVTATVAHHVQDTAKKAARGHTHAQQQIVKVAEAAEKGDPAAKAVADLITNALHTEWGAKLLEQLTGRRAAMVAGYPIGAAAWQAIGARPW